MPDNERLHDEVFRPRTTPFISPPSSTAHGIHSSVYRENTTYILSQIVSQTLVNNRVRVRAGKLIEVVISLGGHRESYGKIIGKTAACMGEGQSIVKQD